MHGGQDGTPRPPRRLPGTARSNSGGDGARQGRLSVDRPQSVGFGETQEAMQIGARDGKAARGQRLVAVVFANGGDGQPDFVVAELALERAGRLVVGDVDDFVEGGGIFFRLLRFEVQVLSANRAARARG